METPKYLQTLWSYKWLLAFGLIVGIVAAFFAGFSITNGQIESRAVKTFSAGTTVLVTSPTDTLYQAQVPGQPVDPTITAPQQLDLAGAAQIYAYIVAGQTIEDQVVAEVGSLDEETESITAIRRTTQPAGDERFPGSLKLPVLEVVGTAATEQRAEDISAAATDAFLAYVLAEQDDQEIAPENRVQLEVLARGAAVEGDSSNPAIPIVITGVAVFLGFVALALILGGIRSGRERRQARARRRDRDAEASPAPDAVDESADPADSADDQADHAERELIGAGKGPRAD
jgi:hypothetical protein